MPDIPIGGGKLNPGNWHLNKTGKQRLIIGGINSEYHCSSSEIQLSLIVVEELTTDFHLLLKKKEKKTTNNLMVK